MHSAGVAGDLKRIFTGAGISGIGKIVNGVSQFAFYVIVGRVLGPESTGAYFVGFAVFQLSLQLMLYSLDNVARRYVPLLIDVNDFFNRTLYVLACSVGLSLSGLVALLYGPSEPIIKGAPALLVIIFACSAAMGALVNLQTGFFHGMKKVLPPTLVWEIIYPLQRLLLTVVFLQLGLGLDGAVMAFLLSAVTAAVLGHWWVCRYLNSWAPKLIQAVAPPKLGSIVSYATPMTGAGVLRLALTAGLPLLLGNYASQVEVALMGTAFRVILLAQLMIMSVGRIFAPALSEYINGASGDLQKLFRSVSEVLFQIIGPFLVLAALFPKEVMNIFGPKFSDGAMYLQLLACAQLFVISFGACDQLLYMAGKAQQMLVANAIGGLFGILSALLGFEFFGAISFPIGLVVGITLSQFAAFIFSIKTVGILPVGRTQLVTIVPLWLAAAVGFSDAEYPIRVAVTALLVFVLGGSAVYRFRRMKSISPLCSESPA